MNFSRAELARFELEEGDVLLNEGQSLELVGRPAIFRGEVPGACFQNTLVRFRCRPFVRPEYALAIFRCYLHTGAFRRIARWTTNIAHLGTQRFAKMSFPLPPLPEQQRIIDAVESYATRLDDAVATLSRVERNLARYRASVLTAAVEGRLVPTEAARAHQEGRDYEPASVLLERILAERRRRWGESSATATYREPAPPDAANLPELPAGWSWASLDQLLVRIEAGKSFRCAERPPRAGEVGVVKVSAVSWGQFQESESKTCTRAELVHDDLLIRPDDFLISRANTIELVGACVIVTAVTRNVMLSDKVLRLRTAGGLDRWLMWVLRSRFGRRQIEALATGNQDSMRNIGQKAIASIYIPLPPEVECRAIMAEIEARMSVVTESERAMQRALGRCARLRTSILTWAVEGKLADQDPLDEPASDLVARFRLRA